VSGGRGASKTLLVNGVAYVQVQTIGRGGSSKVYLVQNPDGELFALKRVMTDSAKQLEAFENEVTLLRQLKHHDHVIQVVDAEVDRERGRINIVMEYGDMDLGRFLQTERGLSLAQIQDLWRQMCEAVEVIHSERIVHSDLKPGNFLLVNGRLKVIDFGIAKQISNDTTNISRDASVGTLSYMAPEAVKQGALKLGRASDIWSLGIILYQMVYDHPPFAHMEPMQRLLTLSDPGLTVKFPGGHRLEGHSAETQAQLMEVLGRCLQRDPRRRPSLPELLAHPFLCASTVLRREAFQEAIGAIMAGVLSSLGAEDLLASPAQWQVLADEVWEHITQADEASAREAEGEGAPLRPRRPPPSFEAGLAPLREVLGRHRDAEACSVARHGSGKLAEAAAEAADAARLAGMAAAQERLGAQPLVGGSAANAALGAADAAAAALRGGVPPSEVTPIKGLKVQGRSAQPAEGKENAAGLGPPPPLLRVQGRLAGGPEPASLGVRSRFGYG